MQQSGDVDRVLNKLNSQRQRLAEQIERSLRALEDIDAHISAVQKESTERLLQDDRVDNALIEQVFDTSSDNS